MTTILRAVKQIADFTDKADLEEMGYTDTNLYNIYMIECGEWNGFTQGKVTEYVKGLPSIVTFPFYNGDILSELGDYRIERKTEKGQYALIENYWHTLGYVVFKMIEKEKNKKG